MTKAIKAVTPVTDFTAKFPPSDRQANICTNQLENRCNELFECSAGRPLIISHDNAIEFNKNAELFYKKDGTFWFIPTGEYAGYLEFQSQKYPFHKIAKIDDAVNFYSSPDELKKITTAFIYIRELFEENSDDMSISIAAGFVGAEYRMGPLELKICCEVPMEVIKQYQGYYDRILNVYKDAIKFAIKETGGLMSVKHITSTDAQLKQLMETYDCIEIIIGY